MDENWTPPPDAIPHIVCAACRWHNFIICGPRHWDGVMRHQLVALGFEHGHDWDQGFVDQFGRFWSREQAMQIVKDNKQPFDLERNGGNDAVLYSEGLY